MRVSTNRHSESESHSCNILVIFSRYFVLFAHSFCAGWWEGVVVVGVVVVVGGCGGGDDDDGGGGGGGGCGGGGRWVWW
jgi:hypothetical protein